MIKLAKDQIVKNRFKQHITQSFPRLENQKLLLAVSGGLDSTVLTHLCKTLNFDFAIAHCNFNLRRKESDADADFVEALAEQLNTTFHLESFDTETYAKDHQVSTQVSARELRYQWFQELCKEFKYDAILTAHHLNDDFETLLINLTRGTGLDGLTGIPQQNENIIRPLLPFSRQDILEYAKQNNLSWREDSSNASDKYLRNAIRHHIIPKFEELNPQVLQNFISTQQHLQQSHGLLEDYTELLYNDLVEETSNGFKISVSKLKKHQHQDAALYQLLKNFNFKDWESISGLIGAQTGKQVLSDTHRLIKDRDTLLLTRVPEELLEKIIIDIEGHAVSFGNGQLTFKRINAMAEQNTHTIYVDAETLNFPLTLRRWQAGDKFQPFGMKGQKKLSDFFKDEKLSLPQKEQSYVLLSGNKIVWVLGMRADDRFKITSETTDITQIIWQR